MKYIFEWDSHKAKTNHKKHHVAFETATTVFKDEHAISIFDDEHSDDEERWITLGMDALTRVLVVVHLYFKIANDTCTIRIISARKAVAKEIDTYKGIK